MKIQLHLIKIVVHFFTPIHPELKGYVNKIEYIESTLDTDSLYKEIIDKGEVYKT